MEILPDFRLSIYLEIWKNDNSGNTETLKIWQLVHPLIDSYVVLFNMYLKFIYTSILYCSPLVTERILGQIIIGPMDLLLTDLVKWPTQYMHLGCGAVVIIVVGVIVICIITCVQQFWLHH